MKKHAIIPIFISHRGCPNNCVFCNQKLITARSGDVTVDDARKTIEQWLTTLDGSGVETEISFFGGSFTGIPLDEQTAFLKLAKEYKDAGKVSKIHCSTRPDYIDQKILDNLKICGMDVIELGVQSFDEKVLKLSKRGHDKTAVYNACRSIKENGFTLGIQLMIGLPGDSYESCMDSVRETIALKPQIARLYPTVVLPGTELAHMQVSGEYKALDQNEMLDTVVDMYRELTSAGINVIRIGLKSNDLIQGDTYHPAFGQMVHSRIAREQIEKQIDELLSEAPDASALKTLEIAAPQELINFASGHKAENRIYFEERYPRIRLRFKTDNSLDRIKINIF